MLVLSKMHSLQRFLNRKIMLRILFGAAALALFAPAALACDGQTGKVIFEDKFTDDSGGWLFGESRHLVLKAPGAMLTLPASDDGVQWWPLNQTFNASQGDFCTEMSFPADAAQLEASVGLVFLATDDANLWKVAVFYDGFVRLSKNVNKL